MLGGAPVSPARQQVLFVCDGTHPLPLFGLTCSTSCGSFVNNSTPSFTDCNIPVKPAPPHVISQDPSCCKGAGPLTVAKSAPSPNYCICVSYNEELMSIRQRAVICSRKMCTFSSWLCGELYRNESRLRVISLF